MAKVYRSMYEDAGKPRTGGDTFELGVRGPGHRGIADVKVDAEGNVVLDGGGMSVFPSIVPAELKRIPRRLIPLRLADKVPGAIGDDDLKIWTMGSGTFTSGEITATLTLNVNKPSHGTVCPAYLMSLNDLQLELAKTQSSWTVEEP